MDCYVYMIPVQPGESGFLLNALRRDLLIANSHWEIVQEDMSTETAISVCVHRPLSLDERRKIVSCGLTLSLARSDEI